MRQRLSSGFTSALALHAGAVLLSCTAQPSLAAAPTGIDLGGVTATPGTIASDCPSGATCGTPVTGSGFFQRPVVVSGVTYYQTIVLPDPPADSTAATGSDNTFTECSQVGSPESFNPVAVTPVGPETPLVFDPQPLAGLTVTGVLPNPPDSCNPYVDFALPPLPDVPSLVADANEHPTASFTVTDGASGAVAEGLVFVDLQPTVSFGLDRVVVEGATATVPVYVSGFVGHTITVPYTIGGTASPGADHGAADGTLVITDPTAEISFPVYADAVHDNGETVVIRLGEPTNAMLGDKAVETVTLSEGDRFVVGGIALLNSDGTNFGSSTLYLLPGCCTGDGNPLLIRADAQANFPAGGLRYDWSGTDSQVLAFSNSSGNTLSFNPDRDSITDGIHVIKVRVSSIDHPELFVDVERAVKVIKNFDFSAVSTSDDSDSDGTVDVDEGLLLDSNDNGIDNPFDFFRSGLNLLQLRAQPLNAGMQSIERTFDDGTRVSIKLKGFVDSARADARQAIMSDIGTGLRLGLLAFSLDSHGAAVPIDQFKQAAAQFEPQALQAADKLLGNTVVDLEVTGLPAPGQSAHVVVPRATPPAGGVIWTFNPAAGWGKFRSDGLNALDSAPGRDVGDRLFSCPDVNDAGFAPGVDNACVRLTLQDGGPNDADGVRNGTIRLLLGEGPDLPEGTAVSNASAAAVTSAAGGGGAVGPLALLWLFSPRLRTAHRRLTRSSVA